MMHTILFDLDGTLLPLEMDPFLKAYFSALGRKFESLFDKRELEGLIWTATKQVLISDGSDKTNEQTFFEHFYGGTHHREAVIQPVFEDFYTNDFIQVKQVTGKSEVMIQAVALLKEKGYRLVVATNPIFPYSAVKQRLEWAGFQEEDFAFITSFERMHSCKPQLSFYKEVLAEIGASAENCMMVGNDVEEDMVAGQLGMKTFLIEDHLIARSKETKADYRGTYEDFHRFAAQLPAVQE